MYNVYLVSSEINNKKLYKIGFTRRDVSLRVNEFRTANASEFEIISSFKSKWGTKIEKILHRHFKSQKINGEWFDLCQEQVDNFEYVCNKYHTNFELIESYNTYVIDRGGLNKIK